MTRLPLRLLTAVIFPAILSAQNPPGVSFQVATPGGRTVFKLGEIIPLTLRLSSSTPNRWLADVRMHDRVGRLNLSDEFHVEPAGAVRDPLEGLPGQSGGAGGLSGMPVILGPEPYEYDRDLNEWVQFLKPGVYRLTVTTRRVSRLPDDFVPDGRGHAPFPRSEAQIELNSNAVTLHIVEAPSEWAASELRQAVSLVDEPGAMIDADENRRTGARILRFLGTPEAVREMVRRLGSGLPMPVHDFRFGILAAAEQPGLLPYMEERLRAPDQAVDSLFVDTLTHVAFSHEKDGCRLLPEGTTHDSNGPNRRARHERFEALQAEYYDILAGSLPNKRGLARAACASALSGVARWRDNPPPWSHVVADSLRQTFLALPAMAQRDLLSYRWLEIADPRMVPVLEALYDQQPESGDRELLNLAVRRLYELDRSRGRARIVQEILEPTRGLEIETRAALEEQTLPEAFEKFRAHLPRGGEAVEHMVLRYGDETLAGLALEGLQRREKAFRDAGQAICITPLHLFLLKTSPDEGEAAFRRAFASILALSPHCLDLRPVVKGAYAWSPRFEELLGELLVGSPVIVKESAAELLGRYGSADAQEPLWAAMKAFHQWWDGREADLAGPDGGEGVGLERVLTAALALGSAWMLGEDEMRWLEKLCVSEGCRQSVASWKTPSLEPVAISIASSDSATFSATVGRFHCRSKAELLAKIAQFAAGTQFQWTPRPAPKALGVQDDLMLALQRLLPALE